LLPAVLTRFHRLLFAVDVGPPRPGYSRPYPFLKEHQVQTTAERGWDTLENGELLKAAEVAGFDVLVTPDKNIRYQQNLTVRAIALVVLSNPRWPVLRLHVERVVAAVNAATPGSYTEVDIPER
jgi:hypothetical protein